MPRVLSARRLFYFRCTAVCVSSLLAYVLAEVAFRVYRYHQLLGECVAVVVVSLSSHDAEPVLTMPWNSGDDVDDFQIKQHAAALYDPDMGFRLRPNHAFHAQRKKLPPRQWRTNSHGHISDDEYPAAKPADEFRLVTIGDSFTQGDSNSVRWQAFLQERLNKNARWREHVQGKFTRIINVGLTGIGVGQFKAVYEFEARNFGPDLVLLNFISEDPYRRWYSIGGIKTWHDAEDHVYKNILGRLPWYRIYPELLASTAIGARLGLDSRLHPQFSRYYDSIDEAVQASVPSIQYIEQQQDGKVLLTHHPMLPELEGDNVLYPDLFVRLTRELGTTKIHYMAKYMRGLKKENESYESWYQLPLDAHPSDRGQEIYAAALEQLLIDQVRSSTQE